MTMIEYRVLPPSDALILNLLPLGEGGILSIRSRQIIYRPIALAYPSRHQPLSQQSASSNPCPVATSVFVSSSPLSAPPQSASPDTLCTCKSSDVYCRSDGDVLSLVRILVEPRMQ